MIKQPASPSCTILATNSLATNTPQFAPASGAEDAKEAEKGGGTQTSQTLIPLLQHLPQPIQPHQWPAPLNPAAFHGVAGDFIKMVEPHTESDPIAVLVQFLIAFGNLIGRTAYFQIEAARHYLNLFVCLVGLSSKGRKGTSLGVALMPFCIVDEVWVKERRQSGLSSGEGLIAAVRDRKMKKEAIKEQGRIIDYQDVIEDEGVEDKRLFVTETEFAKVLKVMEREGNSLSPLLRDAWDKGDLTVMTKTPQRATGAHISIIAHITTEELRRNLTDTESSNGFANRFLWVCSKRSKLLPDGGALDSVDLTPFTTRLSAAVEFAQSVGAILRDKHAAVLWREVYPQLEADVPGLLGSVTARSSAQVMRLACLYALLDRSPLIRVEHLKAALALWRYCEDSARCIFGEATGDTMTEAILQSLKSAGEEGLTRSRLNQMLGGHIKADRITQVLAFLKQQGKADYRPQQTEGRSREVWYSTDCGRSGRSEGSPLALLLTATPTQQEIARHDALGRKQTHEGRRRAGEDRGSDAANLEADLLGVLGERMVQEWLDIHQVPYEATPLLAEQGDARPDLVLHGRALDIKASPPDSGYLCLSASKHERLRGHCAGYLAVLFDNETTAHLALVPYTEADTWPERVEPERPDASYRSVHRDQLQPIRSLEELLEAVAALPPLPIPPSPEPEPPTNPTSGEEVLGILEGEAIPLPECTDAPDPQEEKDGNLINPFPPCDEVEPSEAVTETTTPAYVTTYRLQQHLNAIRN